MALGQTVGPVTLTLTPVGITLQAQPFVSSDVLTLTPAPLGLEARPLTPAAGALELVLQPASLTLQARTVAPAPGAVNLALGAAQLELEARRFVAVAGPVTLSLTPAVLQLVALGLGPGPTLVVEALRLALVMARPADYATARAGATATVRDAGIAAAATGPRTMPLCAQTIGRPFVTTRTLYVTGGYSPPIVTDVRFAPDRGAARRGDGKSGAARP